MDSRVPALFTRYVDICLLRLCVAVRLGLVPAARTGCKTYKRITAQSSLAARGASMR